MLARSWIVTLSALALCWGCGKDDGSGGGGTSPSGEIDGSGASGDTSGGSTDTGGGSTDTGGGSTDTGGGSTDTGGGSTDTGGGSGDTGGGSGDTGGGSGDTGGGSTDTGGGSTDTGGGSGDVTPPAGTYTLVDLGTLGGDLARAIGVNAEHQVVGESKTASGDLHAFLWANGVMTDLGTLGGPESIAYAVSASGIAVGAAQTASGAWRAVLWESSAAVDLGTQPGGKQSFAYDVNDAGQIVGAAEVPSDGYTGYGYDGLMTTLHAMLWEPQGATLTGTDLGALGGGFGRAVAINASGQIAGITYRLGGSGKVFGGAVRWSAGGAVDLATLPQDWTSDAYAIDGAGNVVGAAYAPPGSPPVRAVHWQGTTIHDLGSMDGSTTVAFDVNDAGTAVGTAGVDPARGLGVPWDARYYGQTAVAWSPGEPPVELDGLLFDAPGWHLQVARGIEPGGAIVGHGTHDGATRGFLLLPH